MSWEQVYYCGYCCLLFSNQRAVSSYLVAGQVIAHY